MIELELGNTSYETGFDIFKEILSRNFDVSNNNTLKLFMLETSNKLFNYEELYSYILSNIVKYVFDRKKVSEFKKNEIEWQQSIFKAIDYFRNVETIDDKGAGAELGEILLYLFLEQDLKAPKLFSKVELKTNNNDYIKGCDGVHIKFRKHSSTNETIAQLIIGEAKVYNSIRKALDEAFNSINNHLTNSKFETLLLETNILDQFADAETAELIKMIILPNKSTNGKIKKEKVFGIFIGYSSEYSGINDSNDEFDKKIIEENKGLVLSLEKEIIKKINSYGISNYQFYFYFLPFHNAAKDRKDLISALKRKDSQYGKFNNK